eukprot:GHVP01005398.1.p1 GENE.GHVP01005398.1~~GHVP01005398.1.p1  ORF type:complete len:595 (-),score=95.51 GHVP01005398.1:46-1830(-)
MRKLEGPLEPVANASIISGPKKIDAVKSQGWGYKDSYFTVNKEGHIVLTGNRYQYSNVPMPKMKDFCTKIGVDTQFKQQKKKSAVVPMTRISEEMLQKLRSIMPPGVVVSVKDSERILCSHGHTCQELFYLRSTQMPRVVDVVVYPNCHEDVEAVVRFAVDNNCGVIPYGGGTSVSMALMVPENESRVVISLNTSLMNKVQWIDKDNLMVCVQAGAVGIFLEQQLAKFDLMVGHEPDSHEFSTVGGWVATRASGMKKNTYGNIEDIIVDCKFVTASGTFQRGGHWPRVSSGPDLLELVLGSEGTLGIVTEVVLKVRPTPPIKEFASFVFPDFKSGVAFMREIAYNRGQPASLRLMDNFQFQLGAALKPDGHGGSSFSKMFQGAQKFYLLKWKGFKPDELCAATILYEGTENQVNFQKKVVDTAAKNVSGLPGGAGNGKMGYELTFMIAYIRDFAIDHGWLAESFETAVPWDRVLECSEKVKEQIADDCRNLGIETPPTVSSRVTQVYDEGACLYFYFGFDVRSQKDPLAAYNHIEHNARNAVMNCGGSISHHHGVGKLRKSFMERSIGEAGISQLKNLKTSMDPRNIFASGNLV